LTDCESVYVVERPRILPAVSKFTGFVEIAVMADEPVVMTTDGREPSCNSALSSTMKSHIVTLLTSTTVKAIACDLSRNMFSETSLAQFEVLPSSVVQVSFTIAGSSIATPADVPVDMLKRFVNAFATGLGISKDRISNIEVRDARRRLLDVQMIFQIASNSESNAKYLAEKVKKLCSPALKKRYTLTLVFVFRLFSSMVTPDDLRRCAGPINNHVPQVLGYL